MIATEEQVFYLGTALSWIKVRYPKRIYAYWYLSKVVDGCIIYHHNFGYISMWLYQDQKMWKYHFFLEIYKQKEDPWNFHKHFSWSFLKAPLLF